MTEFALIVDDNSDYVKLLQTHLEPHGFQFDRVGNAAEGVQRISDLGIGYYSLIVTDITMEGQTAGLQLIRKIRRYGYRKPLMVASTGFNNPAVLWLTRWLMKLWGVDILVPKKPLKAGRFEVKAISKTGREFVANRLRTS